MKTAEQSSLSALSAHLERLLAQEPLPIEALLTCLQPSAAAPSKALEEIELLAFALNHERLHSPHQQNQLPQALSDFLEVELVRALPLVGKRPIGTTFQMAQELVRHVTAERRKLELVSARAADASEEQAHQMLTTYLGLGLGPLYVAQLRERLPERFARAEEAFKRSEHLEPLRAHSAIALAMCEAQPSAQALGQALEAASAELKGSFLHKLRLGLISAQAQDIVISAALALWWDESELAPLILERLTHDADYTGPLTIIAALLDPLVTQHYLSLFIAEMSWGNPEEPELELTPARIRLLLIARDLLPKLGHGLAPLNEDALGPLGQAPEVLEALHQSRRLFEALQGALTPA